jgi:hypothetical protein
MKTSISTILAAVAFISSASAFAPSSSNNVAVQSAALFSTMADSGVPPASSTASDTDDALIPTKLPSDCGMDYVPLATMLASGNLAEADQVCILERKEAYWGLAFPRLIK